MDTQHLSRRITANRLNAQKSTGPKTAEGKRKSSQNAIKHGLTAATHITTVFDKGEDFHEYQAGLLDHFNPNSRYEAALVDRIITLMWRLRRIPTIEAAMMQNKLGKPEANHPSSAYTRQDGALEFLHLSRYEANLDRCLHRALKDLECARDQSTSAKQQATPAGIGGGRSSESPIANPKSRGLRNKAKFSLSLATGRDPIPGQQPVTLP